MKTTFDLPDPLLRKAKALAARQGRPLRELVAEAIDEKVGEAAADEEEAPTVGSARREGWERWKSRLQPLPDGSWLNPEGIDDESFFQSLDEIRREAWALREP